MRGSRICTARLPRARNSRVASAACRPQPTAIAGGREDFGLAIYRTDTGTAGSFYGCLAPDGKSPSMLGEWIFTPDAPTNLVPYGGGIVGEAKPTLSAAAKSQDTTLTGWTTAFTAGDIIRLNVDSATTVTRVTLSLNVDRS